MKRTIAAALVLVASGLGAAADDSADATIVADKVRSQGFACTEPVTAVRNEAASKPDQAAYVLTCANATYNVLLTPDEAAQITLAQ